MQSFLPLMSLLFLLAGSVATSSPSYVLLDSISASNLSASFFAQKQTDYNQSAKQPTVVAARPFSIPNGSVCDQIIADIPFLLQTGNGTRAFFPGQVHLFIWPLPVGGVGPTGFWNYAATQIRDTAVANASNGWASANAPQIQRFVFLPTQAIPLYGGTTGSGNTTSAPALDFALGLYVEMAGVVSNESSVGWLGDTVPFSIGVDPGEFDYIDVYGNAAINVSDSDTQIQFTTAPTATALYATSAMSSLAATIYARCSVVSANATSYPSLPALSWSTIVEPPSPTPQPSPTHSSSHPSVPLSPLSPSPPSPTLVSASPSPSANGNGSSIDGLTPTPTSVSGLTLVPQWGLIVGIVGAVILLLGAAALILFIVWKKNMAQDMMAYVVASQDYATKENAYEEAQVELSAVGVNMGDDDGDEMESLEHPVGPEKKVDQTLVV